MLRSRSDLRTVGLTEADLVSLGMADDARLDHVRRKIGQRADDASRLDGVRNDTTRVDPLEPKPLQIAADALEIPPGDAVLRADDDGVRPEEGLELRGKRRQAVRLDAEEHHVGAVRSSTAAPVTVGLTSKSPSGLVTRRPRSCIARKCGPRANSTTSTPGMRRARETRADVAADGARSRR